MDFIDTKVLVKVKEANCLFRSNNLAQAIQEYERILKSHTELTDILQFNLDQARSKYSSNNQIRLDASPLPSAIVEGKPATTQTSIYSSKRTFKKIENLKSKLSIAVLLHVYHEDVVDECLDRIDCIPFGFKLFVTTPLEQNNAAVIRLKQRYPNAEVLYFQNAGRDIGPFIRSWSTLKKYDICCKVHTKKGVSDYIEAWKQLCFNGILQSSRQVEGIVRAFENDKTLALAGAELLYGSLEALGGNNKDNIKNILREFQLTASHNSRNGFFMGTMFWFRTKSFNFISKLSGMKFAAESGQKDGMVEHALERIFGSYFLRDSKILLTRPNDKGEFSAKTVCSDYQSAVTTFHKHFDEVHNSYANAKGVIGHIHTGAETERTLSGWLALKGNDSARQAIIRIDETFELDVQCNRYRADLQRNGINSGNHAFHLTIPFAFMDGGSHVFELIDKYSGKIVSTITKSKQRVSDIDVIRSYADWDNLKEQKFIARLKKTRPKHHGAVTASIIMPTYNRVSSISNAINSVLMQDFEHFELIIVDDGSTDHTESLIKRCYKDSRIKYKRIKNSGVSNARNVGLERASGDFVFFLDSDNSWSFNFLSVMISYMNLYSLNSSFCGLRAYGEDQRTLHYKGCDFSWADCLQSNYVDLNAFGFRREAFYEVPKFNISLKRLVDWDYILRIAQYNSISYAPFLGVNYYDGANDRITNTVYTKGEDLNEIIKKIQGQFSSFKRGLLDLEYTWESLEKFKLTPKSKNAPSVATLVTTYNHEKHVAQAICSVLNQVGDFNHTIIISDDGSTDGTREIINFYAKKHPQQIIDLSAEHNVGVSANMHRCIEAAKTKYLAICEGDDFWTDPRKLSKQIKFLEKNINHSMVFSQIIIKNENKDRFETLPRQENISTDSLSGWDFIKEPTMNLIGNFSCCLFRTAAMKTMPQIMFRTRLNEIAVAFYLETLGKIGFIKEIMSVYRQHANGLWTGSQKIAQLRSGLAAREMARAVSGIEYWPAMDEIIKTKYLSPLNELESDATDSTTNLVMQ